jgi:Ala-tRNA(Pro) deacylase
MSTALYEVLDRLGIAYRQHDHEAAFTVEQADRIYGHLPGTHTKNLFLRNKKGDRHYLLVVPSGKRVDLKALRTVVGESTLSFASPERLMKYLGVTPGAVTPLGLIHDRERAVCILLDRDLLAAEALNFHPLRNTATLALARADFQRFLEHQGNEVRVLELPL